MKQGGFDYRLFEAATGRDYDPWFTFIQLMPGMFQLARDAARDEAISYRNFHVGAAIYAINEQTRETAILSAGNKKANPDVEKYCAERSVIDQVEMLWGRKAIEERHARAIGLVVAGTTDKSKIAEVTGRVTPTLHPCDSCRNLFEESLLIRSDTLVVSIGDTSDVHQVHSVAELQKFYLDEDQLDAHNHEDPDFADMEMRQAIYGFMTNTNLFPAYVQESRANIARMALTACFLGEVGR